MSASGLADIILARAAQPGGASRQQLTAANVATAARQRAREQFDELVADGRLQRFTRAPVGGRGRNAEQYFTDAGEGAKWAACTAPALRYRSKSKPAAAVPLTIRKKPESAVAFAADAPVFVPVDVKRTVAPSLSYDPRFQLDPAKRVVGGFQSMGIGRYLEGDK